MKNPFLENFRENAAVRAVVVGDEDRPADELRRNKSHRMLGPDANANRDMESAAAPWLAVDPDPSAHHGDEPRRDGQAETCAAKASCRRPIGLIEGIEDHRLLVSWNADAGIGNGDMEQCRAAGLWFARDAYENFTLVSELDGIADEIHQDLLKPSDVGNQGVRYVGRHFAQ